MKRVQSKLLIAISVLLFTAASAIFIVPAFSFLPLLTSSKPDHWSSTAFPVHWNLNPSTKGAKVAGDRSVAEVMQASFNTWTSAPNTDLVIPVGLTQLPVRSPPLRAPIT